MAQADIQLPRSITTVNEEWFDALIRHQTGLMRYNTTLVKELTRILDKTEEDIQAKLLVGFSGSTGNLSKTGRARLSRIILNVQEIRRGAWADVKPALVSGVREVALAEASTAAATLTSILPVEYLATIPAAGVLNALVNHHPFEGRVLKDWAGSLEATDLANLSDTIKIGYVQGQTAAQIAKTVIGTKAAGFADGATAKTRRGINSVTRTALNSLANASRREFFKENKDIIGAEVYVATLDSRTTPICQSLDGKKFPVGEGAIPPLHFNCRSLRVGTVNGEVVGNRPSKPFTEKRLLTEFTKKNKLSAVTTRQDLPRGTKGKYDTFARKRKRDLTGTVPAKVTYSEWLKKQPASFQDEILGPTRGKLFRTGRVTLSKFVARNGDLLTLKELAASGIKANP